VTATVSHIAGHERWISLDEFADYLGMRERWVRYRVAEGMPTRLHGGRRRVRITAAEEWLRRNGHLEEEA
jgi:hypothetical protein